jgi:formate transporter
MSTSSVDLPVPPSEMLARAISASETKASMQSGKTFLSAILAGMYIAFGGVFSTVIATGTAQSLPYGIMKSLQGLVFSLGLILVVIGGAELFTGNMLMVTGLSHHKITWSGMLKNWGIVYVGNFAGSLLVAALILLGKSYQFAAGDYGLAMLKIAAAKSGYQPLQAFSLGILCNILVCLAVWLTYSAKNTTDKILAILFPISAFIAAGFEHSVANMYLVPVGLLLKVLDPGFVMYSGLELSSLTWPSFLLHNLLPVTIGNMIGGILFVGLIYAFIYKKSTN